MTQEDSTFNQLTCYFTNIQSLLNKRGEVQATIDDLKPDIIGITESWCNETINNNNNNNNNNLDLYSAFSNGFKAL